MTTLADIQKRAAALSVYRDKLSALFLTLAGFPLGGMGTQVLVKIAATTAVVMGVRLAVLRQPHRAGGERHA